jgi:quinol monooxygenase YgiN
MPIVMQATWVVSEGSEEVALDALSKLAPLSRAEPGCRLYQPYRDPADPQVIHIVEIYDDGTALEAHTTSEHFERYVIEQSIPVLVDRKRHVYEAIDV